MKKLLPIAVMALGMFACSSPRYAVIADSVDLSVYAREGIFVTTATSVSFDYTPISVARITECSGVLEESQHKPRPAVDKRADPLYQQSESTDSPVTITATPQSALRILVEQAKAAGGDALIDVRIIPYSDRVTATALIVKRK